MPSTVTALSVCSASLLFSLVTAVQPGAPSPVAAPLRDLPWAQLNFLHTTDTHGWHAGHLSEPSYAADWGDYVSFAEHLHARADAEGVDLVLVDTGDRIEGNGLYDASEPKGRYTYDILKAQDIDLISIGNHEMYRKNASEMEFYKTVPNFKGSYVASNVDIYNPETGKLEALALRFKKFTTKNQGIRILAFGFLFDFKGNWNNTKVTTVEDTIKKDWFQQAIRDKDVDLIVVFGHVAPRSPEYDSLFKAIRSVQWDTPIQFFAGHLHIRDYQVYDSKSVSLSSGRYMETIGFMSIQGLNRGGKNDSDNVNPREALKFSRRYIDNNLFSLRYHSGKDATTFPTPKGQNTSEAILAARKALKLERRHGCAPKTYWMSRAPYPHNDSIFSLLTDHVLPDQLVEPSRKGVPALAIINTGGIRFDIFKGPYTTDADYQIIPFPGGFKFFKDVPYKVASRVLELINHAGPVLQSLTADSELKGMFLVPPEQIGRERQAAALEAHSTAFKMTPYLQGQVPLMDDGDKKVFAGYTTHDDAGDDGDDTVHSKIEFFNVPNCVQASLNFKPSQTEAENPEKIDLVFNDFVQPWIVMALQYLGEKRNSSDVKPYVKGSGFTDILASWVEKKWHDCSTWD